MLEVFVKALVKTGVLVSPARLTRLAKTSFWKLGVAAVAGLLLLAFPMSAFALGTYVSSPPAGQTINFGNVTVGTPSTFSLFIQNTNATETLTINSVGIAGPNAADFSVATATPFTIAPNTSQNLSLRCVPSAGGPRTATLTVNTSDTANPTVTYPLTCNGAVPVFGSTPPPGGTLNFGDVPVGASATQNINVTNTGGGDLFVSGYGIAGANSGDFIVTAPGAPFTVFPTGNQNITVRCTPGAIGTRTATLTIQTNDPAQPNATYNLTCNGIVGPVFSSTPAPGSVINITAPVGGTNTSPIDITNTGNADLNVSAPAGATATITFNPAAAFTLIPNDIQQVLIICAPTAQATTTTTLSYTTNDPARPTVNYTINCIGEIPNVVVTPPSGSTINLVALVGSTTTANIDFQNTGAANLLVNAAVGAASPVSVNPNTDFTVAPAGNQIVTVNCTPTARGLQTRNISFATNDPDTPTINYTVNCTGQAPIFNSTPAPNGVINLTAPVGGFSAANITVTNTGDADLNVSEPGGIAPPISVNQLNPFTIAPAGPAEVIQVTCAPTAAGTVQQILSYTTNDPANATVTYEINCTGNGPRYTSIPGVGATIPLVARVGGSTSFTITVTNTGNQNLVVDPVTGVAAPISVTPAGGYTTLPNGTQQVVITCAPTSLTPVTQIINFPTNDPALPNAGYSVSCTGSNPDYESTPAPGSIIQITTGVGIPTSSIIQVSNIGGVELNVSAPGALLPPFTVTPNTAFVVQPGGGNQQTVTVTCNPTAAGFYTDTLRYTTDDPTLPNVTYELRCTGVAAVFNSNPPPGATINIVAPIGGSVNASLVVSNTGTGTLVAQPSGLSGSLSINPATGIAVAANAQEIFTIICAPVAAGTVTQTLTLATNDQSRPSVTYTVICTGNGALYVSTPPPSSSIVLSAPLGVLASATIAVRNDGNQTLNVSAPSGIAAPINVVPTTAYALAPGGTQNITLSCTPTTAGAVNQTLTYTTNDAGKPTVTYQITCVGIVPGYDSTPVPPGGIINFGNAVVGLTTADFTLNMLNTGGVSLNVNSAALSGANADDFRIISPVFPVAIAPNGSVPLTLRCNPTAQGLRTATLTLTTTDPNKATVTYTLNCQGVPRSLFISTPPPGSTINVEVPLGKSGQIVIQVQNGGGENLIITNPVLGGPNASEFRIVRPIFPLTIAPGGAVPIEISCTPLGGARLATLTFATNDSLNPTVTYTLICAGFDPALEPAELVLQLSVSPDRVVASNQDNIIGYRFVVKNVGIGKALRLSLYLPLDPNLTIAYTEFDNKKIWVTEIGEKEVRLFLPDMATDEQMSGTIYFRPRPDARPANNTKVVTRFRVVYDDATGVAFERISNSVNFIFGNDNISTDQQQLLTPQTANGAVGDSFTFTAPFPAPKERVFVWLTPDTGPSFEVKGIDVFASPKGELRFTFRTAGLQPGRYFVAVRGAKSESLGNATLFLSEPSLQPGSMSMALGEKATFNVNFLAALEPTSAWLNAPDGSTIEIGKFKTNGRGELRITVDSAAMKLKAGVYTVVVYGNFTKLTGTARLELMEKMSGSPAPAPSPTPTATQQPAPPPPSPSPTPTQTQQPAPPPSPSPAPTQPAPAPSPTPSQPAPSPSPAPAEPKPMQPITDPAAGQAEPAKTAAPKR